jgi:hypothetical protein
VVPSDPLKCAVVFNVQYYARESMSCKDIPYLAHVEQGPDPLHPGQLPPLSNLPGHWRISLLVTLNKDRPEQWRGHLRTAQPRICGHWRVYLNIVLYFSSSNTVFWNVPPNGCLHSTDCSYMF